MTDNDKRSQCIKILEYLREGRIINPKIARILFNCERLASRINDLKNRGHAIEGQIVSYTDEDGNRVRYKEYFLERGA
jgi:hypothetical protein